MTPCAPSCLPPSLPPPTSCQATSNTLEPLETQQHTFRLTLPHKHKTQTHSPVSSPTQHPRRVQPPCRKCSAACECHAPTHTCALMTPGGFSFAHTRIMVPPLCPTSDTAHCAPCAPHPPLSFTTAPPSNNHQPIMLTPGRPEPAPLPAQQQWQHAAHSWAAAQPTPGAAPSLGTHHAGASSLLWLRAGSSLHLLPPQGHSSAGWTAGR